MSAAAETDARLARAAKLLQSRVSRYVAAAGGDLTRLRDFDDFVEHQRRRIASQVGVKMPDLAVVLLQHPGGVHVHVARRDLDHASIQMLVRNWHTLYPDASPRDLAAAVRRAWPEYRPDAFNVDSLPVSTRGQAKFN